MPSRNPAQRLRDIVDNIDATLEFTARMDRDDFVADRKTLYAVVRVQIISEATRRLPAELKDRHPEIDRVAVAAAGNVYRHEYEGVDENLIWHTVRYDLGDLRTVAAVELERLRSG
ncbi:MAG: DUF86 domain-containing protein [Acidobacteria bacterium]|nr:DUF86 domain-containing protein [Acidobacteriota bacterium]MBI3473665.1 DUF86 domain-containing protein [Candidatus Solibacter usitatus]